MARLAVLAAALVAAVLVARSAGLSAYLGLDGVDRLRDWVEGFGALAPLVFIAVYAAATVAFIPGTPLSLLAGVVFGALLGMVWVVIGATVGATLAFLIGRYAARDVVASWAARNPRMGALDRGVERHGWRMLLVTRLVPLFPFNLQNYAYGLTGIRTPTYVLLTAVCIVPGAAVYTLAGGSIAAARDDLTRTFVLLGAAAVLLVAVSLLPRLLRGRSGPPGTGVG